MQDFLAKGKFSSSKEEPLLKYLEWWLRTQITGNYSGWQIYHLFGRFLVLAFKDLGGNAPEARMFRAEYLMCNGYSAVPSPIDPSYNLNAHYDLVSTVSRLMAKVTDSPWMEQDIQEYCFAQLNVLKQVFQEFICQTYTLAFDEIIKEYRGPGFKAKLGTVDLRMLFTGGRVWFDFAKYNPRSAKEETVVFSASDSTPWALDFGLQELSADILFAIEMIREAAEHFVLRYINSQSTLLQA